VFVIKKYIEEAINTKLLVLQTDNHLNWKNNIERIIPKLSEAFYAFRLIVHISNINTSKLIYYEHFLSITKCGKFGGGGGGTLPTVGRFLVCKRKSSKL